MNKNPLHKLFRGHLYAKFFDVAGHWRTWRKAAIEAEQEDCILVVFQIPAKESEKTVRAIQLTVMQLHEFHEST